MTVLNFHLSQDTLKMKRSSLSSLSSPRRRKQYGSSTGSRDASREVTRVESTLYNTPFKGRRQSICLPNKDDAHAKRAIKKLKGEILFWLFSLIL